MFRVLAILVFFWCISASRRNQLPPASTVLDSLARDPVQSETTRIPFTVRADGVNYRITPQADYELRGLVVSYHNADSLFDLHHKLWKDKLNFRDLGVVWGSNALDGLYQKMNFSSGDFTLYYESPDRRTWSRFRQDQVSNNHILATDPTLQRRLRRVRTGDQIMLRGVLCDYSHPNGSRGTSLTRTDRGNGACETVFVESLTVLREANSGWRFLMDLSGLLIKLFLPYMAWQLVSSLRRKPDLQIAREPEAQPGEPGPEPEPAPSMPVILPPPPPPPPLPADYDQAA